jgi:phosphate/sulfate permease
MSLFFAVALCAVIGGALFMMITIIVVRPKSRGPVEASIAIGGIFGAGMALLAHFFPLPGDTITRTEHTYRHIAVDWTPAIWVLPIFAAAIALVILLRVWDRRPVRPYRAALAVNKPQYLPRNEDIKLLPRRAAE